ncbi:pilus assembly protein PilO [Indiicoccus explosivorum]|uniref:pilus assembly protein PilO n=1 Tax=Indiicoccus explosivorum TaxID=1917864 RepID=UPI000B43D1D8|nr:pilus assembly protein PilO [Indiicoccus explosivorum]
MTSLTKSQKEKGLIVLSLILLLGVAAYSYFMMYKPARDARVTAEQTLESEREVVIALEAQLAAIPNTEPVSARLLQQQVPVEPLADRVLLQIEQAEVMSETVINSVEFAQGPFEVLAPAEGVEKIEALTTSVTFTADNYADIAEFITEIEKMERILIVDGIEFSSYEEQLETASEFEPMDVTLSFSAFYRPDLVALEEAAPQVDAPSPAAKLNPLPMNDGTDLNND